MCTATLLKRQQVLDPKKKKNWITFEVWNEKQYLIGERKLLTVQKKKD